MMIHVNIDNLTTLEESVQSKLTEIIANTNKDIRILEAAKLCNVSPSTISKLVRKQGFDSFKQYKLYFSGQQLNLENKKKSSEIERLISLLENFDSTIITKFVSIFNKYDKIILFGFGPSFISAEYFAYKLAVVSNKNITVTQNEDYAEQLVDENTLLIVFSVTGKFTSFDNLFTIAKDNGSEVMLILEEYVNTLTFQADHIFYLSKYNQNEDLLPFEKTRTVFFIFMEEVISKLKYELDEMNKTK